MEPAAMLVRALEIHVGRECGILAMRAAQHRVMGGAGIEPDVQGLARLIVVRGVRAEQLLGLYRLPGLDAAALDTPRSFLQQLGCAWMQRAGLLVQEEG